MMPYKKNSDLPDPVKNHLPEHAQDIYRAAFNNAWNEYNKPNARRTDDSQEQVAHKVAWAAVKKKYHKVRDNWEEIN
jgi:cation transport regulator